MIGNVRHYFERNKDVTDMGVASVLRSASKTTAAAGAGAPMPEAGQTQAERWTNFATARHARLLSADGRPDCVGR